MCTITHPPTLLEASGSTGTLDGEAGTTRH